MSFQKYPSDLLKCPRIDFWQVIKGKGWVAVIISAKGRDPSDFFGSVRLNEKVRGPTKTHGLNFNFEEHRMTKTFGLIKSVFGRLFKPREIYPPIRPAKVEGSAVEAVVNVPQSVRIPNPKKSKRTQSLSLGTWDIRRSTDLLMSSPVSRMFPLPTKRPKKNKQGKYDPYIRKIKNYTFIIEPSDKYGCPSVVDGLFILFFIDKSRAIQSRNVSIDTVKSIFDGLGYAKNGEHYKMLRDALNRFLHSGIYIIDENSARIDFKFIIGAKMSGLNKSLEDEGIITKKPGRPERGVSVVLGELFYQYANRGSSPYDMAVFRLLAGKPGALGFYLNVASRSFSLLLTKKKAARINLLKFLHESGSGDFKCIRKARWHFRKISSEVDNALRTTGMGSVPTFLDENDVVHLFAKSIVPGAIKYTTADKALADPIKPKTTEQAVECVVEEPKKIETVVKGLTKEIQAKVESIDFRISGLKRAIEMEHKESIRTEFVREMKGLEKVKAKLLM